MWETGKRVASCPKVKVAERLTSRLSEGRTGIFWVTQAEWPGQRLLNASTFNRGPTHISVSRGKGQKADSERWHQKGWQGWEDPENLPIRRTYSNIRDGQPLQNYKGERALDSEQQ